MNGAYDCASCELTSGRMGRRVWRWMLALAVLWGVGLVPGTWQVAQAEAAIVSEATAVKDGFGLQYAVPGGPRHIAPQAAGQIWFTAATGDGVGLVTVISPPGDPVVRYRLEFYGLTQGSEPYDIAYRDGVVWFTLRLGNALGRLDTATRAITLYDLPSPDSRPTGLDIAPNGDIWIAVANGRLVRFAPDTATFVEYIFPDIMRSAPRALAIRYQNERNIWFTMPDANALGNYNSVTDRFLVVPTGEPQPAGLELDPTGRLWVTALGSGRVGRYTPTTNSIWVWYNTSSESSRPVAMTTFDMGGLRQLWVSESALGSAARLQLDGGTLVTRIKVPLGNATSRPWDITRAPGGSLWIADSGRNLLVEMGAPYVYLNYLLTLFR